MMVFFRTRKEYKKHAAEILARCPHAALVYPNDDKAESVTVWVDSRTRVHNSCAAVRMVDALGYVHDGSKGSQAQVKKGTWESKLVYTKA